MSKPPTPAPVPPGRFESPLPEYPGYIQFPHPFTLLHFKAWWKASIEPLKLLTRLDFDHTNAEWEGAKVLLEEYGEWNIQGVPKGEVKVGNIPMPVLSWVLECADQYIAPQLNVRKRRLLATAT